MGNFREPLDQLELRGSCGRVAGVELLGCKEREERREKREERGERREERGERRERVQGPVHSLL